MRESAWACGLPKLMKTLCEKSVGRRRRLPHVFGFSTYPNLFTSIRGSNFSFDRSSSSHVSSRFSYATCLPSIAVNADSTPSAAWLWNLPLEMLLMNASCFSLSACARLSEKIPLAENSPRPQPVCRLPPPHSHFSSPQIPSGPEYGDEDESARAEEPLVHIELPPCRTAWS